MQIGCCEAYASFVDYYEKTKQFVAKSIIKCCNMRRDPEAIQRVCILVISIFESIKLYHPNWSFPDFIKVLDISQSLDFYRFLRIPKYLLHPYAPKRFMEEKILEQLEEILCTHWQLDPSDSQNTKVSLVKTFAKEQLTCFLVHMTEENRDFRSEQEVQFHLCYWLADAVQKESLNMPGLITLATLQNLQIPLKPKPWLTPLIDAVNILTDLACVPCFLHCWSLINLEKYALRLGTFSVLKWLPHQELDRWIWGGMSLGFLLQSIQAIYYITRRERKVEMPLDVKWLFVVAASEFCFSLSIVCKKDVKTVAFLAIIAKSIGLLSMLFSSDPSYFCHDI